MATINIGIERNSFDYIRAYAEAQSSDSVIVDELIQAYVLISKNLGISPYQLVQQLQNQGNPRQQSLYLAAQMNSVRAQNALLGLTPNNTTPLFISREIGA